MRPHLRFSALHLAFLLVVSAAPARALVVSDLKALHRNGQTFITWTCPPGTGWTYRVWSSDMPIWQVADYWYAHLDAVVGDSSWCDRRLSRITGTTYGYVADTLPPLDATKGLAVLSTPDDLWRYYCVMVSGPGVSEERRFVLDGNTLFRPVLEEVAPPKPVYQRTLQVGATPVDVYTLWTSTVDTPEFPAMANRANMAYDCGVGRGGSGPSNPLFVGPHARGGNFLQAVWGTGTPGEWRLALDDPLWNNDGNSYWYGWHENYDDSRWDNPVPVAGTVRDYTLQRILYTVDWARHEFPIDLNRVYTGGYSMGGIGATLLAFEKPEWFAAVISIIGKYDFGYETEPDPQSPFNTGGYFRTMLDRMWGTTSTDLPTPDGTGIYEKLDFGYRARFAQASGIPPLIAVNGRNDWIVGWAEKIAFYRSMQKNRLGGVYYWDQRNHSSGDQCQWQPMHDMRVLYRYRNDVSFPALSGCSADRNPGNGNPASGDTVGSINGFVDWDATPIDEPERWETTLQVRDLHGLWKDYPAPESLTVHVTPRRVQIFPMLPYHLYSWNVTRLSDRCEVQSGIEQSNEDGVVTFYRVKVYRGGSLLRVQPIKTALDVPLDGTAPRGVALTIGHNPASDAAGLAIGWPVAGQARVDVLDVTGRSVRTLFQGVAPAGPARLRIDTTGLPQGVYFVAARQGAAHAVRRLVIIR